jgi:hypothetical protein
MQSDFWLTGVRISTGTQFSAPALKLSTLRCSVCQMRSSPRNEAVETRQLANIYFAV